MNEFVNSLAEISSTYTIFEKDQILTESQLNSITSYLDPQDRLTRVNLFGVGIVNGLDVSHSQNSVNLEKGLGVTTDGDIICESTRRSFDRFREYGLEAPKYSPLYKSANTMFPVWELLPVGDNPPDSRALSQFNTVTGKNIKSLTCVLLVESYVKDEDFCQLDGCENIGKDRLCNVKLLVLEANSLSKLKHDFPVANKSTQTLTPVANKRAIISPEFKSAADLNGSYLAACKQMNSALKNMQEQLKSIYPSLIQGLNLTDWAKLLNEYAGKFDQRTLGVQYYYDFLSDLCDVWNELCLKSPQMLSINCPDFTAFPKHLILGALHNQADKDKDRFEFYPNQVNGLTKEEDEFIFLTEKIDAMIGSFNVSRLTNDREFLVTPSIHNASSIGDGAIPFYYIAKGNKPLHKFWNYKLNRQNKERYNYGFRAKEYGALPPASEPLLSRIEHFPFFRVEGHVGTKVETVVNNLEKLIAENALPFVVRAAYLGTNKDKLVKKKGLRYSDLHRFHHLIREDISHQLEEVKSFSKTHKQNIDKAFSDKLVANSESSLSKNLNNDITEKVKLAQNELKLNYSVFASKSAWKTSITDTMKLAGRYKKDLGKVTKTEFSTPFDGLIDNTKVNWLPWLDHLINEKDKKEDDKLVLSELLKQYPGLNHAGGVVSGGTFVLIYDDEQKVVADCMVSYYIAEPEVVEQPDEPALPKPNIRPLDIVNQGVLINPSREDFFNKQFIAEKQKIDKQLDDKFKVQEQLAANYKESVVLLSNSFGKFAGTTKGRPLDFGLKPVLANDEKMAAIMLDINNAINLREMVRNDPTLSGAERKLKLSALEQEEKVMAANIESLAKLIEHQETDFKTGSTGAAALTVMNHGLNSLNVTSSGKQLKTGVVSKLKEIGAGSQNAKFRAGINKVI